MGPRRWVVAGLATVWAVVPVLLAVGAWPRWWSWIAPEQTPMTWLQSVVLVLAAAGSLLLWHVLGRRGADRRAWLLLAAGFTALAFDERFAVHERIRDGVLAPRGVRVPVLPWVAPGDFLLLGVAVLGLLLLPVVWRAVRPDPGAARALAVGVALAVVAVAMDSIDPSTWSVGAERVQQSAEEVIELGSGLALLAAVVLRLLGVLDTLLDPAAAREAVGAQDPAGPIAPTGPASGASPTGGSPTGTVAPGG